MVNETDRAAISISIILFLICVSVMLFAPRFAQDIRYHNFADSRMLMRIPNFWNVVSNLPFAIVGITGLFWRQSVRQDQRPAFSIFCISVVLIALGSAYYHWTPNNSSLLWDRLPITIAFMALFAAILGDSVLSRQNIALLISLVMAGLASAIYWYISEQMGAGDLRPYALVQFLPIPVIVYVLLSGKLRTVRSGLLWLTLIFYVLAKILEHFDVLTYQLITVISGHSLKHVSAAIACWFALLAFRSNRSPASE
ncbi:MAG: ceramidase domain-containing protein [Pseudomonadota bacterium]